MRHQGFVVFMLTILAPEARGQDVWTLADINVVRLPPSAFGALPAEIRGDLDRRGCRIPQTLEDPKPHNVISGDFVGWGEKGWAVLCSINRASRVLVYDPRTKTAIDSVEARVDKSYLQQVSGGRIGFSRLITTAAPDRVRRALARLRHNALEASHDGIEIAFIDKASFIAYWTGKRWMLVAASD